jgi:hypothetical protein
MLVLNRSLMNREYILINVLKALALIISVCNLRVTFSSKITPRYFTLFTMEYFVHSVYDRTQAVDYFEKSKSPESYLNLF